MTDDRPAAGATPPPPPPGAWHQNLPASAEAEELCAAPLRAALEAAEARAGRPLRWGRLPDLLASLRERRPELRRRDGTLHRPAAWGWDPATALGDPLCAALDPAPFGGGREGRLRALAALVAWAAADPRLGEGVAADPPGPEPPWGPVLDRALLAWERGARRADARALSLAVPRGPADPSDEGDDTSSDGNAEDEGREAPTREEAAAPLRALLAEVVRLAAERDAAGVAMPPGVPTTGADRRWRDALFLADLIEEADRDPWHAGRVAARRLAQLEDALADPHPGAVPTLPPRAGGDGDDSDDDGGAAEAREGGTRP